MLSAQPQSAIVDSALRRPSIIRQVHDLPLWRRTIPAHLLGLRQRVVLVDSPEEHELVIELIEVFTLVLEIHRLHAAQQEDEVVDLSTVRRRVRKATTLYIWTD